MPGSAGKLKTMVDTSDLPYDVENLLVRRSAVDQVKSNAEVAAYRMSLIDDLLDSCSGFVT